MSGSVGDVPPSRISPGTVTAYGFSTTEEVPYQSTGAEVTKAELHPVQLGVLSFPKGWEPDLTNAESFEPTPPASASDR